MRLIAFDFDCLWHGGVFTIHNLLGRVGRFGRCVCGWAGGGRWQEGHVGRIILKYGVRSEGVKYMPYCTFVTGGVPACCVSPRKRCFTNYKSARVERGMRRDHGCHVGLIRGEAFSTGSAASLAPRHPCFEWRAPTRTPFVTTLPLAPSRSSEARRPHRGCFAVLRCR